MIYHYRNSIFLVTCVALFTTLAQASEPTEKKEKPCIVKVLLEEHPQPRGSWNIISDQGFFLIDPADKSKKIKVAAKELHIRHKQDRILINNEYLFKRHLYIVPRADHSVFNKREYAGFFSIVIEDDRVLLINGVPLEKYVASVLCTESWPGWSLEVNKVFAVASRTYVIAMVQQARKKKRPYHVKNSNIHQTYTGGIASPILEEAVAQTKGYFLTYNNKPIIAMFDACCGGIIPSKVSHFKIKNTPYLARSYACTACKGCKIYSWQGNYTTHELESLLKKEFPGLRRIKDIKVTAYDRAGLVKQLLIKGTGGVITLPGKKVYSLLNKKVKSFCFEVHKRGSTIIFKGWGYGHHMGLCQWGARALAAKNWDYRSILNFYYPGTVLMRLA